MRIFCSLRSSSNWIFHNKNLSETKKNSARVECWWNFLLVLCTIAVGNQANLFHHYDIDIKYKQIRKCSKLGGKLTEGRTDKKNQHHSLKTPSLRLRNFFSKRNFDTGLEISFVGTMDISSYTQSEQPTAAEKYLTRLAKNGMVAVTCIATLLRRASLSFWKGRQSLPRSLDF